MLIDIGYSNMVESTRVLAIVNPESAPIKRLVADSKEDGCVIDASCGKKTKAVIILDSGHIVLSAYTCEKLNEKYEDNK